jgi:hypothetical protein
MKHARMILMAFAVIAISAFVYADNAYQVGYDQGYRHGISDRKEGMNFDIERYRISMSDNSYNDSQFVEGFKDGYSEGYNKQLSNLSNEEYTYRERDYRDRDYRHRDFRSEGTVVAFKDKKFEGTMMQFPIGRYADLDDMNWDHSIESMQVPSDVRVILFEHKNFKGQSLVLENDAPNLGELNFKKRAESMIIEPRY